MEKPFQKFLRMTSIQKNSKNSCLYCDSDHFQLVATLVNQGIFWSFSYLDFYHGCKDHQPMKYGPILSGLIFFAVLSMFANLFVPFQPL